eukprot:CAMPEP_0178909794 /NCGR_PEP_ID=MMETSP0786-20121207/8734_1 /TAXON_ID=186022 /ORGANISM="Thalassionema frauenfeldii, Strain CCMP 1798" /LENGTH=468 /DNA_ID=CAMNT_0020581963 /DNA_START=39 /DNA_END=1441 /DNA_ORIENTATION=-
MAPKDEPSASQTKKDYDKGTNYVEAGIEANLFFFGLILAGPFLTVLLAYVTSPEMDSELAMAPLMKMIPACVADVPQCLSSIAEAGWSVQPTYEAMQFILGFMGVAWMLEVVLPGKIECGPETLTGHIPKYKDNAILHCIVFSFLFWAGSNLGFLDLYDFGIMYDLFPSSLAFLNIFGMLFCVGLMLKGLYFPSTDDSGSSGSLFKDYVWGTELYPRIWGLDLKRFINCRFAMTYWQLAGFSFCYRSYTLHGGELDWGLFFSALSQYLYLFKFFLWEMGYMRSIDIIVDRAGFEIQWGCLVWVPSVYTLHTRFSVMHPTGWSKEMAAGLFVVSMLGVVLNYLADRERDVFRATNGQCKVWGRDPKYITAEYEIVTASGKTQTKKSLLLASGFWGMARHFQYFFELQAAWSWCLLANPWQNGVLVLWYAVFLTTLLIDRADRDSRKCHLKYGPYYEEYCRLVPYKIVPG